MKFSASLAVVSVLALPYLAVATPLEARQSGACDTGSIQCCESTIDVRISVSTLLALVFIRHGDFSLNLLQQMSFSASWASSSGPLPACLVSAAPPSASSASALATRALPAPSAAPTTTLYVALSSCQTPIHHVFAGRTPQRRLHPHHSLRSWASSR